MTSLPEQLSEARKMQLETQIDFMRAMTAQAFECAGQVLALNINTSRASAQRSANTFRQLFAITDPRDLFTLGAQTQEQFQTVLEYSRELFGIASGARLNLERKAAALPAPQRKLLPAPVSAAPAPAEAAPAAAAPAPAAPAQEHAPKTVQPSKKPAVATDEPATERPARAKAIAQAVSKVAAKTAAMPHPAASPVTAQGAVEIAPIHPVDAAPPLPAAAQARQSPPGTKGRRKK